MKKKILVLLLVVLALTFCAQIYTTANAITMAGGDGNRWQRCCFWTTECDPFGNCETFEICYWAYGPCPHNSL